MIRSAPPELAFTASPPAHRSEDRRLRQGGHPLDGLSGSAVADRFCAWATRSGRRIIVSVIPLDRDTVVGNLPLVDGVVLAVRRAATGPRQVLWAERIVDRQSASAIEAAVTSMARQDGYELHLHLLAPDAVAQQAVLDDLSYPRLISAGWGHEGRVAA